MPRSTRRIGRLDMRRSLSCKGSPPFQALLLGGEGRRTLNRRVRRARAGFERSIPASWITNARKPLANDQRVLRRRLEKLSRPAKNHTAQAFGSGADCGPGLEIPPLTAAVSVAVPCTVPPLVSKD